jgi:hypothetical protein
MQLPKPKALRPHITRNSEGVPCKAMPVWRPHPVSPYSSCTTTCRSSLLHKYCSQHQEQGETFWNWKGREVWNEERYCESVEKRETKRNEGRRRGSLKQRGRLQTHQHWRIVIFQLTIFFPRWFFLCWARLVLAQPCWVSFAGPGWFWPSPDVLLARLILAQPCFLGRVWPRLKRKRTVGPRSAQPFWGWVRPSYLGRPSPAHLILYIIYYTVFVLFIYIDI